MLQKLKKNAARSPAAQTGFDGEYVLDVEDLSVRFDTDDATVYAVNGIDLKLRGQSTLGLVGETGAGKTTSMLSLLRLVPSPPGVVTSRHILVRGREVTTLSQRDLQELRGTEIAMIFQDPMTSLNPVMTVGEQIAEAVYNHEPVTRAQAMERARAALETIGIPGSRADDYPHQFSGGMKQRVVIAIALACRPAILIADEPTTALDVTIQAQVLELMKQLKQTYRTSMIMITHDLGIIAETCDDVAVMYAGRIVEQGTLRDVFKRTRHPYTEGLFNSLPDMTDRTAKLTPIPGLIPDPTVLPTGCPFADRCGYAVDACRAELPARHHFSETHWAACSRYDEPDFSIRRA